MFFTSAHGWMGAVAVVRGVRVGVRPRFGVRIARGACRVRRARRMRPASGGLGLTALPTRVLACAAIGYAILAVLLATAASASASGWSRQLAAKPASKNSALTAVSCTSRRACVAVGYFMNKSGRSFALVERWNGIRWSIQPNPAGTHLSLLSGVSCTSARACTAVGSAPPVSYRTGAGAPLAPTSH